MNKFISFEGIDGSGKTTQARKLSTYLNDLLPPMSCSPVMVREPGGTPLGERIRQLLLDKDSEIDPKAEAMLFAASRAQIISQVIQPALDRGSYVIADRFLDSTLVYQGHGRGLNLEFLRALQNFIVGDCLPAITFYINISPEKAASRMQTERRKTDRIEDAGADFRRKIYEGYQHEYHRDVARIIEINGDRSEDLVFNSIINELHFFNLLPQGS